MDFFLHHDMRNLPKVLDRGLKDLRRLDESSRIMIESLAAQELDLFEEIQRLAKENPDFDEAPLIEKYQNLLSQRLGAQNKLDDQMKRAQKLYDIVDGRITFVDSCVKDLGHLMPDSGDGTKKRKKRKRKSADNELPEEVLDEGPYDPSEPIYCTCRQISYGQMIACENPDCATEWFHFACVGLKTEPKEPWFCPECH